MALEVSAESPLAQALATAMLPKLAETGWSAGGFDDQTLSEYIILMLVNGKTQEQVAHELSEELLQLGPDDAGAREFSSWLFSQLHSLNAQLNGSAEQSMDTSDGNAATSNGATNGGDEDMADSAGNGSIPTGPKSMRNGSATNGNGSGRDKRMLGNINKQLNRGDAALHKVRGGGSGVGRVNSHSREPPKGPRSRLQNNVQHMANQPNPMQQMMPGMMPGMGGPGMPAMTPEQQMEMMQYWEQGARMMQQLMSGQGMPNGGPVFNPAFQQGHNGRGRGKSLMDRTQPPRKHNKHQQQDTEMGESTNPLDTALSAPPKPAEETRCRYDIKCTNPECPYVHQSPVATAGIEIDMSSECSYGAACKNFKCVGKHPSPAKKTTFQQESDCKWGPLCKNPKCHFKHSSMPACRNGADCAVPDCKFAHTKIDCAHNPCTRPTCPFKHGDGQRRGKFVDQVWTAEGAEKQHLSERKFVDEDGEEELILPGQTEEQASKGDDTAT